MTNIQSFDYSVDLLQVLLWQYNEAPNIQKLIELKQSWYETNQRDFWENWVRDVFDLRTANQFGLSVWAKILCLPITIDDNASSKKKTVFGFGKYNRNFYRSNFYGPGINTETLTSESARILLRLRYYQLTSSGRVEEINKFLDYLFGDLGGAYVIDNLDMSITYVFRFDIDKKIILAANYYNVFPRPAGVGINIITPSDKIFAWDINNDLFGGWDEAKWGN